MTSIVFSSQRYAGNAVFQSIQVGASISGSTSGALPELSLGVISASVSGNASASGLFSDVTLHPPTGLASTTPNQLPTIGAPVADISTGDWSSTGANLWSVLDEASASDADYISTTSASSCQMVLNETAYPGASSQIFSYRAESRSGSNLTVTLKQGATTIAEWSHALTPEMTTYSRALSANDIAAIVIGAITVTLSTS